LIGVTSVGDARHRTSKPATNLLFHC
jgi:hypothetical protein